MVGEGREGKGWLGREGKRRSGLELGGIWAWYRY